MSQPTLSLSQAMDLADHASPAPSIAAEALKLLRAEMLRLQVLAALAFDRWIAVTDQLPPLDVPVWLRAGTSCFVGARTLVGDDEWLWCDVSDRFWLNPDGTWQADIEVDGDTFKVESWLPLPSLSSTGSLPARTNAAPLVEKAAPQTNPPAPEAFLLQHVKDGEAWEHHWFIPRWGDVDPTSLHGRAITIAGVEHPELGTYRVKAFVPVDGTTE